MQRFGNSKPKKKDATLTSTSLKYVTFSHFLSLSLSLSLFVPFKLFHFSYVFFNIYFLDQVEGAEHREMLMNEAVLKAIIEFVCKK